ncbi:hypothetical protein GJ496_006862 [Pomphorhynchus laevis]|nr:hypothetical protein GJ496_006862 [Pomphorhynchus laevis]
MQTHSLIIYLCFEIMLSITMVNADHLRGMMFNIELVKHENNNCVARVELTQIWQTHSTFAKKECPNPSKALKSSYQRFDPEPTRQIIHLTCDQLTNDETSTVKMVRDDTVPCNRLIKYYLQGCCWIPFVDRRKEGSYDVTFSLNSTLRSDGKLNRIPRVFIPPALRVPIGKKETSRINVFDPDFDKLICKQPVPNEDCKTCNSVDNLNNTKYVKINSDCTLTTNFPPSQNGTYFKVMFVLEERDKVTGAFLSKSSNLMLLIPAKLKCGERGQTTIKIEPDDKKFIPGKTYTMITITKPPCGEVSYEKSIFSILPPGSKVSKPSVINGVVTQNMTFVANEKLCEQMIPICAYSMDRDNYQSKASCEKIFCRGYEHLLGVDSSAAARKKKLITGISLAILLLLLLLIPLILFIVWKKRQNQDDDESVAESTEISSVESEKPVYENKQPKKRGAAVSSSVLDDDE